MSMTEIAGTRSALDRYAASRPDLQDEICRIRQCDNQDTLQQCFNFLRRSYADRLFLMAIAVEKALAEGWAIDMGKALKGTLLGVVRGETSVALLSNREIDASLKDAALKRLSWHEQEIVAADALHEVVIDDGGDIERKHFSEMSQQERSQVIGPEGLRNADQQLAHRRQSRADDSQRPQTPLFFDESSNAWVCRRAGTVLNKQTVIKMARRMGLLQ